MGLATVSENLQIVLKPVRSMLMCLSARTRTSTAVDLKYHVLSFLMGADALVIHPRQLRCYAPYHFWLALYTVAALLTEFSLNLWLVFAAA